jgi:uncharacterized protein YcaQ
MNLFYLSYWGEIIAEPTSMLELSIRDARRLFLASQGLLRHNFFGRGKSAVRKAIEQLSYVQIDTISVIERAHHHVLWSRIDNYKPAMLDFLQRKDHSVFEYWSHAASFIPMRDYRFYLPAMQFYGEKFKIDSSVQKQVLERIRHEGPLRARDFEDPHHNSAGWWNWKPAKLAMEQLFLAGELMVTGREGFQKIYDIPDRALPGSINTVMPTEQEWQHYHILLMINALGMATEKEITYLRTARHLYGHSIIPGIKSALAGLVEDGVLIQVNVAERCYYCTETNLDKIPGRLAKKQLRFLSPFDGLIIQRKRTRQLFNFDYQLECYVPKKKRVHGYFVLPILWGDQLVGRMDAKADRKTRTFHIYMLGTEPQSTRRISTGSDSGTFKVCTSSQLQQNMHPPCPA